MKIDNIFITMIDQDNEWDEDNDTWKAHGEVKFRAYGRTESGISVHLVIDATTGEREEVLSLLRRVTERVKKESE
jgi:hypothetical protein